MSNRIELSLKQLNEFKQMLDAGIRKVEIAAHFGISADVLNRICKENNFTVRLMTCKLCGKQFNSLKSNRTICKDVHYRACEICGSKFVVSYNNLKVTTCSSKCLGLKMQENGSAKLRTVKAQDTFLERYGVTNPGQSAQVQQKMRSTCIERYGVPYAMQSAELVDKYNAHITAKSADVRAAEIERQRQTMQTRYNGYPFEVNSSLHSSYLNTMIAKHGGRYTTCCPDLRDKVTATTSERYGVPWGCMLNHSSDKLSVISKINKLFQQRLEDWGLSSELEFHIGNKSYDLHILNSNVLIEIDPTYTHNSFDNHWHCPVSATYHGNPNR